MTHSAVELDHQLTMLSTDVVTTGFVVVASGLGWSVGETPDDCDLLVWKDHAPSRVLVVGLDLTELPRLAAQPPEVVGAALRGALRKAIIRARALRADSREVIVVMPAVSELRDSVARIIEAGEDDGIDFLLASPDGRLRPPNLTASR